MDDRFPDLPESTRVDRLERPAAPVPAVLDTDTYNEIDDQFAVVQALGAAGVDLRAIHAAPFDIPRLTGPGDGMERSHAEIGRLLDRTDRTVPTRRGAERFLDGAAPVESPATEDLIRRADAADRPPYVLAIGATTNS